MFRDCLDWRQFICKPLAIAHMQGVGGVLANNPENMIRWIRSARDINPHTAMPSTGITEQQARDITAYLYPLR
ncbi:hypothetical protein LB542_28055 [Mesorhizobium sp. BR1-1-9]|uniref:c-type cytochrome n=1 Tax=unclassified Mesorhizobium TaxID=325217 RepID=UPI001CD172A0|nr:MULTISPECIES: hypothetical protein [unclassified Mesorhizobium]MBZ9874689.1 hypothetical protein [Mesorhizobium sp. BR1-1-9]MBZ9942145.1 hypothetical protein [Mesorhizobium sp. BR1-1-13]